MTYIIKGIAERRLKSKYSIYYQDLWNIIKICVKYVNKCVMVNLNLSQYIKKANKIIWLGVC